MTAAIYPMDQPTNPPEHCTRCGNEHTGRHDLCRDCIREERESIREDARDDR